MPAGRRGEPVVPRAAGADAGSARISTGFGSERAYHSPAPATVDDDAETSATSSPATAPRAARGATHRTWRYLLPGEDGSGSAARSLGWRERREASAEAWSATVTEVTRGGRRGARASSKANSAPPSGASPIASVAPWASTIPREMYRPSPAPGAWRPPSRRKRSKTVVRSASGIPSPASPTANRTRSSWRSTEHVDPRALGRVLPRVVEQVRQDADDAVRVAEHRVDRTQIHVHLPDRAGRVLRVGDRASWGPRPRPRGAARRPRSATPSAGRRRDARAARLATRRRRSAPPGPRARARRRARASVLSTPDDRRERRPELVRRDRDELRALHVGGPEPLDLGPLLVRAPAAPGQRPTPRASLASRRCSARWYARTPTANAVASITVGRRISCSRERVPAPAIVNARWSAVTATDATRASRRGGTAARRRPSRSGRASRTRCRAHPSPRPTTSRGATSATSVATRGRVRQAVDGSRSGTGHARPYPAASDEQHHGRGPSARRTPIELA